MRSLILEEKSRKKQVHYPGGDRVTVKIDDDRGQGGERRKDFPDPPRHAFRWKELAHFSSRCPGDAFMGDLETQKGGDKF